MLAQRTLMAAGAGGIITADLQLYLDAGDSSSYSGSGQTWSDLSGNSWDFYRGIDNTSAADDPAFNGSAGDKSTSTYWSFDGTDTFGIVTSAASGSFLRKVGRSDQPWTLIAGIYFGSTTANQEIFDNGGANAGHQIWFGHDVDARLGIGVTGTSILDSDTNLSANTWYHVAIWGMPDGATTCGFHVNGSANGTGTISTTFSAGDSGTGAIRISGRSTDTAVRLASGSRLQFYRMYDRILSSAEILQDYNATKVRLGH